MLKFKIMYTRKEWLTECLKPAFCSFVIDDCETQFNVKPNSFIKPSLRSLLQAERELMLSRKMLQWKVWEPLIAQAPPKQWKWPLWFNSYPKTSGSFFSIFSFYMCVKWDRNFLSFSWHLRANMLTISRLSQ